MYAVLVVSILLAGAPDVVPQPMCDDAHALADFDRTHEELGLVGAAPLYGLEAERTPGPAINALNAQAAAPSGAAPLFGLEELPSPALQVRYTATPTR